MHQKRTIFITGTDTGVGKTVLTALLLEHFQSQGILTRAMKLFCSGDRQDAKLLKQLHRNEISIDEINPFHVPKPVAPWVVYRQKGQHISLQSVVETVQQAAAATEVLLIEGIGGVMVPLGKNYGVLEVIGALNPEVLIVGANKLGVLNHFLLTLKAVQSIGIERVRGVLMERSEGDESRGSNYGILRELIAPVGLARVGDIGCKVLAGREIGRIVKKFKKGIAEAAGSCRVAER